MSSSHFRRMGVAVGAALSMTLAACGGDTDTAAGDTAMVGGTAGAMTDTGVAPGAAGAAVGAMSDEQIMSRIGSANGIEIASSEIARDKATNADVKQFARDMVDEHQRLQGQADSLATQLNITPAPPAPDSLVDALEEARNRLTGQAAGAEFDRMYMDMQVQAHQNTLDLLNQASNATQNAELRTLIQNTIPVVQQHLDRARQISSGLGTAG
ncbi:MAG TPA: DUF4142 domain-containing protein [Gemmatimonadales bacterium]